MEKGENKRRLAVEKDLREKRLLGEGGDEQKSKSTLREIAENVDDLVRNPKNMTIFRDRDKRYYRKVKKYFGKYTIEKLKNDPNLKEKIKKDEPYPLDYLHFPLSICDSRLAHIVGVFDMADEEDGCVPYDKDLSLWADYVRLTILHDRELKGPRTEPINNGIWAETDLWAKEFWEKLRLGWSSPEVASDLSQSYIRVMENLNSPEKKKNEWKPPRGYIGSKEIQQGHNVPRSTLEGWQNRDTVPGGELEGKVKKDPQTQEVYYPKKWFEKRFRNYKPREH